MRQKKKKKKVKTSKNQLNSHFPSCLKYGKHLNFYGVQFAQ